ncbi:hypothetical protein [Methanosarcina sp.]|uniref:hypothetical protein n=1 Tax=Methanosarcina sp. TaxID=2213 RepID=UPI003C709FEF
MTGKDNPRHLNIKEYYRDLYRRCGEILELSLESEEIDFNRSHNFLSDLEIWMRVLSLRPEVTILQAASREYQFSLLALALGQYRQAFMALRLFLELSLTSVHFSAHELDFRIWEKKNGDIKWNILVDNDNGVFSKQFVEVFCEDLADEALHYKTLATKVYRECSEYVHGNSNTHDSLPEKLQFISNVHYAWLDKAKSVRQVVSFALSARYLMTLDNVGKNNLEHIVCDELGHLEFIRLFFGNDTEEK